MAMTRMYNSGGARGNDAPAADQHFRATTASLLETSQSIINAADITSKDELTRAAAADHGSAHKAGKRKP